MMSFFAFFVLLLIVISLEITQCFVWSGISRLSISSSCHCSSLILNKESQKQSFSRFSKELEKKKILQWRRRMSSNEDAPKSELTEKEKKKLDWELLRKHHEKTQALQKEYISMRDSFELEMEKILANEYFPAPLPIVIMGENDNTFLGDMLHIICRVIGSGIPSSLKPSDLEIEEIPGTDSVMITLAPYFESKQQFYKCREELRKDSRVHDVLLHIESTASKFDTHQWEEKVQHEAEDDDEDEDEEEQGDD